MAEQDTGSVGGAAAMLLRVVRGPAFGQEIVAAPDCTRMRRFDHELDEHAIDHWQRRAIIARVRRRGSGHPAAAFPGGMAAARWYADRWFQPVC